MQTLSLRRPQNLLSLTRSIVSTLTLYFAIALIGTVFSSSLAFSASLAKIDDGLVAYYPFDGNANDESGNGNHGTVFQAVLAEDRLGQANSAYRFDGLDDYISARAKGLPTGERTMAFWFFANRVDNAPVIVGYGGGQLCGVSWFMGINARPAIYNDRYYVTAHCFTNNLTHRYSPTPVGKWVHWAVSTQANGTTMYIDGIKVASNTNFINDTVVERAALAFGVATGPGGGVPYIDDNIDFFDGLIDEVRIYDRALSDAEVRLLTQLGDIIHPGGFEAD